MPAAGLIVLFCRFTNTYLAAKEKVMYEVFSLTVSEVIYKAYEGTEIYNSTVCFVNF